MISLLAILFWISVYSVIHTYIIFPLFVVFFGSFKKQNQDIFDINSSPFVSIIVAAHNEGDVIYKKLESTIKSNYENFEVLIGSDCSSDDTNSIIKSFQEKWNYIQLFEFKERQGKANIINQLVKKAKGDILIFTDANVFFDENTIYELTKHYKNEKIGQVGGNIINTNLKETGISIPEKDYLNIEKKIKYNEGKLWGTMIGAFGGCYSMRKSLYKDVPKGYLMDDFYISMNVLDFNFLAIFEPKAICHEDVSDKLSEEFRRKIRISAGNFQNLFSYKHLLFKLNFGLVFSFLSHKVLRWKTPVFIIFSLITSFILGIQTELYKQLFYFQLLLFVPLCLDLFFGLFKLNIKFLRFVTHFYAMNLALLLGLFKFIFGVKTNIWKPTERNQ